LKLLKAVAIAFSTYSKIPMPQFSWKDEDMRYSMCFFPWVGAVIGGLVWLWFRLAAALGVNTLTYVLIGAAIPLLVTGGFHVDGYMDTMDAFHSYRPREQKLEILKDPHIGAFSVIMLAAYGLLYLAGFAQIVDSKALRVFCCGFFLSRCFSGIGVISLRSAKKEGMLFQFCQQRPQEDRCRGRCMHRRYSAAVSCAIFRGRLRFRRLLLQCCVISITAFAATKSWEVSPVIRRDIF